VCSADLFIPLDLGNHGLRRRVIAVIPEICGRCQSVMER
jgi:hypothetical protein